jgi:basic membrane lipoprotein Med (substrate-binding protein (PBP1-ABC) superfamily)
MRSLTFFSLCVLILGLTGCAGLKQKPHLDPFLRRGDWSATGAANETIAEQAANRSDLIYGKSDATSNGVAASAALDKALGAAGAGTAAGLQTPVNPTAVFTSTSTGD